MATERIRERAYSLWVAAGQPEGRAVEHWLQAEREVGEAPDAEPPLGDTDSDVLKTLTEPDPDSGSPAEHDA
jgi:hypothetical protein